MIDVREGVGGAHRSEVMMTMLGRFAGDLAATRMMRPL